MTKDTDDRTQFGKRRDWCGIICGASVLLAIPFYYFCTTNHICMAGHMKHPPYPQWHMLMDRVWLVLLIVAGVVVLRSSFRGKIAVILLAAFIAYSRLGLQSGGGQCFIYEYIAFTLLALLSLYNLLSIRKTHATATRDKTVHT